MTRKTTINLREKSDEQLQNQLKDITLSLIKARSRKIREKNKMYLRHLRKTKARILTILNERKKERGEK